MRTHRAVAGIALQPAVAAAVKAGAWAPIHGEVAAPASLKPRNRHAFASQDAGMHARSTQSWEKDADPDSSRLPIVWDYKLSGSERG